MDVGKQVGIRAISQPGGYVWCRGLQQDQLQKLVEVGLTPLSEERVESVDDLVSFLIEVDDCNGVVQIEGDDGGVVNPGSQNRD